MYFIENSYKLVEISDFLRIYKKWEIWRKISEILKFLKNILVIWNFISRNLQNRQIFQESSTDRI